MEVIDIQKYKTIFSDHVKDLQNKITKKMNEIDANLSMTEDIWSREDDKGDKGGGGITRAFSGEIFENAGVNTSEVFGAIKPEFAKQIGATDNTMWAAGISLILHPKNPRIPTVHANFRMIFVGENFWFGGGADLTPFYPNVEDFKYFHGVWKKACSPYGYFDKWKDECDKYFVNKHRNNEMRGVGGIFYDHFNSGDIEADFNMFKDISNHFIDSYFPIVEKRLNEEFTDEDVDFQLHRRGRYVEFNLLHDRGTHFGLKSNGRVDSILISLPARCNFTYCYKPKEGSPHAEMLDYYYPKSW